MKKVKRLQFRVKGLVQGVGFRPHVYQLAMNLGLTGLVYNDGGGVLIEIQGKMVDKFQPALIAQLPTLARIDDIHVSTIPVNQDESQFNIVTSQSGKVTTKIAPDSDVCEVCIAELFDPESRFYQYPFINCIHCGPRFTITQQPPYDRCQTSMANFTMCKACEADYANPLNRRFHAQPIACAHCGPQLSYGIKEIAGYIRAGKIVAIKGLGGYQLICDAYNEDAVKKLRERKERVAKPFAVMVANIASARLIADCSAEEINLLTQRTRPIVLAPKRSEKLAASVAPGLSTLGIMLLHTPLHYLLFQALVYSIDAEFSWLQQELSIALVVTSANVSGEPLIIDNENAEQKLKTIADVIVTHNRPILWRADDSVMRITNNVPLFIRRARSYVPLAIPLAYELPTTLALGAYLKNTICVIRGKEAFISQHIGDLDNVNTIQFYHETIKHFLKILDVKPEYIAHDLHPDFYSSQIAGSFNVPTLAVQHHHAHLAAVAAEYQINKPAFGLALDGYGMGEEGEAWGGEMLLYQVDQYQRLGSLMLLPQPGGDKAATQPWRMAASILFMLGLVAEIPKRFSEYKESPYVAEMLSKNINTPLTSSCGRLFAAASALLNVCTIADYEGQAAMLLESLVTEPKVVSNSWSVDNGRLNLLPLFNYLLNCNPVEGANIFHGTLAAALCDWLMQTANLSNVDTVLLNGGCFVNRYLTESLIKGLNAHGIKPLLPSQAPVNDGGISLGQAWVVGNYFLNHKAL